MVPSTKGGTSFLINAYYRTSKILEIMETHSPINCWTCRHCILNIENNARDYVCQRHHKVISNNPFAVLKPTDCKDWEK